MKKARFEEKKQEIWGLIREESYHPMTFSEILDILGWNEKDELLLKRILDELEQEGKIVRTKRGRYGLAEEMNLFVGVLEVNPRGFGFLVPDNPNIPDIYISAENMNGAMHGDRVLVKALSLPVEGKRIEGYVERILKRGITKVVGRYEDSKNFGFVIPDDQRITYDIYIPKSGKNKAKTGQKVVVEITRYPRKEKEP